MNDLNIEMVTAMKYLGNIVNKTLSKTDHISNRIRLTAAAIFKLNQSEYDESLDLMTIIQLYKTYGITTLLYGLENLNLNVDETERISTFEKAIIKKSLNFAPFHHLLDALKINIMEEKINVIKMSFIGRLLNNNYTREFTKEIIKLYKGIPHSTSILKYALTQQVPNTD